MHRHHTTESLTIAALLSISGGLQDIYTYLYRGHIFANAQTGNIVLMSYHLSLGEWGKGLSYLMPVFFFAMGILAADMLAHYYLTDSQKFKWETRVLYLEIFLLAIVGFMPLRLNFLANPLVSFSCAMQVQTFRKVRGYSYASTMCIGDLRAGMSSLCSYAWHRERQDLQRALTYFAVIACFACGAGLGALTLPYLAGKTIWLSSILLLIAVCLLALNRENNISQAKQSMPELSFSQQTKAEK